MRKSPFLFATGLLCLVAVYTFSRNTSQAQPTSSVRTYVAKPDTSGPDTLANWMKEGNTSYGERVIVKGQPPVMVRTFIPWTPLKFVKLEVAKPKPIKHWEQDSDDDVYTKFAIEMTAPNLKLPPPKKRKAHMDGYSSVPGFPTSAEIRVLEAKMRPTPSEPWVTFNPESKSINYSNIDWDFGVNGSAAVPNWTNRGNILRAEDTITCPGGGQWKLKVRFRASVSELFSEKSPTPLWGFEKIFWLETQKPHNRQEGVSYPIGLHKSWIKGISYATNPNGPWKPIPQRGQAGFPLRWSQNNNLYFRAEKKYPAERWPTDKSAMPYFEHGNMPVTDNESSVRTGDPMRLSRLKQAPQVTALTPRLRLDTKSKGQFVTVKAEAGNLVTATIQVAGPSKLPRGNNSWDDMQGIVMRYSIGEHMNTKMIRGRSQQVQVLPGEPATIHLNVWGNRFIETGQSISANGMETVTLRDGNGKLLAKFPHDENGKYKLIVPKPGRYFVDVDVPGPDGKPLHRNASLRRDPRYAEDISQRITLDVKAYQSKPVTTSDLTILFQPWKKSGTPNVWQRTIIPISRSSIQTRFNFTIKPMAGYSANPQVSWLEVKPRMATQYYRLLSPLPEGASRQMNVYDVQVKAYALEMSREDYLRSLR